MESTVLSKPVKSHYHEVTPIKERLVVDIRTTVEHHKHIIPGLVGAHLQLVMQVGPHLTAPHWTGQQRVNTNIGLGVMGELRKVRPSLVTPDTLT